MKYSPDEFTKYLDSAHETVTKKDVDKLKSEEFSMICLDLVLAARELDLLHALSSDVPAGVKGFAGRIVEPYYSALGVVAASPFLPQRDYETALEEITNLLDHPRFFTLVGATQRGFHAKADALGLNSHSLVPPVHGPFSKADAGYLLATRYETLGYLQYGAKSQEHGQKHIENVCVFMEKLEKTRDRYPDWNDHAAFFKHIFSDIADHSPLGRKDPSIAKILRLVNDGAPLVSVEDCVKATEEIFNSLAYDERSSPESMQKNLDRLDDHGSFYEVVFQSKFFELNRGSPFMDRGFQYHSPEGRESFGTNLKALVQRLEGRVPDPKIVLAGFLLGKDSIDALILKDRAQGNPQWLEHAILDRAHDPRALQRKDSSLSVVLATLLSGADEAQVKAFWDARPERRFVRPSYESEGLSR